LFLTGEGIALKEDQRILDAMKEVGLVAEDSDDSMGRFVQWYEGWGHSPESRFAQAHQRIEQIMQW